VLLSSLSRSGRLRDARVVLLSGYSLERDHVAPQGRTS